MVGAGSAGCVLANRLTEDAATKVLLVEAGPKVTLSIIIFIYYLPSMILSTWLSTGHNPRLHLAAVEDPHAGSTHLQPLR